MPVLVSFTHRFPHSSAKRRHPHWAVSFCCASFHPPLCSADLLLSGIRGRPWRGRRWRFWGTLVTGRWWQFFRCHLTFARCSRSFSYMCFCCSFVLAIPSSWRQGAGLLERLGDRVLEVTIVNHVEANPWQTVVPLNPPSLISFPRAVGVYNFRVSLIESFLLAWFSSQLLNGPDKSLGGEKSTGTASVRARQNREVYIFFKAGPPTPKMQNMAT